MLDRDIIAALDETNEPISVKIAHQMFIESQYSNNKLSSISECGKSYLFNDNRAGVIVADRGLPWSTVGLRCA